MSAVAPIERVDATPRRFWLASPRTALGLALVWLGFLVAAIPLAVLARQFVFGSLVFLLLMAPFTLVGLLVAVKQPRNPIGWILLAVPLGLTVGADAGFYAVAAFTVGHHGLPLARLAVVLSGGWVVLLALLPLPILLFPDGHVPSRHWRWTLWAFAVLSVAFVVVLGVNDSEVFTDRRIRVDSSGELANGGSSTAGAVMTGIWFSTWALLTLSWVIRQVVAFRRSTGERRQQFKWLMSGGAICIIGLVDGMLLNGSRSTLVLAVSHAGFVAIMALPVGIGVGILKYRLYEIDRLISRTLSYLIVTGTLVGVFLSLVVLITRVLPFSSPIAVAASTLAAAALFNPLRKRTQHLVDRRFNRARYDAEATVTAFRLRLREAVDLDTVQRELLHVVEGAVEPAHASLWIRPSGTGSPR